MSELQYGVATVDITPPVGVPLWGYDPRNSTSVDHALRAEALVCDNGNGAWILISADVGAFSSPLVRLIQADVAGKTGLRPESILLAGTHTHSGPYVTDAVWREQSDVEKVYLKELREKLVQLAVSAWGLRAPGEWVYAQTRAPDLASNRRRQKADGSWMNQWADPQGQSTGYCDSSVDLLGVRRKDGGLDALLVNYGCHPVCLGSKSQVICGDYVSYLKDALEASGLVKTVLFAVAGHGNVDPRQAVQVDPVVPREMGENLAAIVLKALPGMTPVVGTKVGAVVEPWTFQTTWELSGRLRDYFPHHARGAEVRTGVAAFSVGDLAILGLPGEAVSEYREIFRRQSPFSKSLLFSIVNDFIGYLPTDEIIRQGGYEARLSPVQPMEEALCSKVAAAFGKLKDRMC